MSYGWTGKYAEVDLKKREVNIKNLPEEYKKDYLGSRGINSKFLYDLLPRDTEPLSPENILIFGVGPLVGTLAPACGRWTVSALSPLTGILGDANAGGHWGTELKYAGFDHLVIKGKAETPVYLWVTDGKVEIRDASHLWGTNTWETTDLLMDEIGEPDLKVACIGQAGEKLIRFSCVISDRTRAAGRTGMGAVMGSKNLKAVAAKGSQPVQVADPEKFTETALKLHKKLRYEWPIYEGMAGQGTMGLVTAGAAIGWLPVRYFNSTEVPLDKVAPEIFEDRYKVQNLGCFGCPVHCGHFYEVREGTYRGTKGEGPEYETFVAVGPKCGIFEIDAILHMTNLMNQYGLDSIDTGNAIAILMQMKDKGYIKEEDIGLDLSWGNAETAIKLIEMTVKREGIGDTLAEGSYLAAQKLHPEGGKLVWQIKGMDNIGVDTRALKGASLSNATSTRGLDHLRGLCVPEEVALDPDAGQALYGLDQIGNPDTYEQKAEACNLMAKFTSTAAATGICLFNTIWICAPIGIAELGELLSHATGHDYSDEEFLTIGERIFNLERLFITELGISREDDYPSEIAFEEPIADGVRKGAVIDREKYETMLDDYYAQMGWDPDTGIPLDETLTRLNLKKIAADGG